MSEDFFIQIKNLTAPRIDLLETSKLVLQTMRLYENIIEIRQRKSEATKELKEHTKELLFLHSRLTEKLPHQELANAPIKKQTKSKKQPKTTSKKKVKQPEIPISSNINVDKIDEALSDIEAKLRSLN